MLHQLQHRGPDSAGYSIYGGTGLEDDEYHEIAKKYYKNGFGGMLVFGVKGEIKTNVGN